MKTRKQSIEIGKMDIGGMDAAVIRQNRRFWWSMRSILLCLLTAWTLLVSNCPTQDDNAKETPKPVEVTFNVPAECTNLNQTKPITILYPATFTTTRMDKITGKFVDSMRGINTEAETGMNFRAKINAILDRGFTITVEETNSLSYGIKAVNNQLVAETSYIENEGVVSGNIASGIIKQINNGNLE